MATLCNRLTQLCKAITTRAKRLPLIGGNMDKVPDAWHTDRQHLPVLTFCEAVLLSGIEDARAHLTAAELQRYMAIAAGQGSDNPAEDANEYLRTICLQRCSERTGATSPGTDPVTHLGVDHTGEVKPASQGQAGLERLIAEIRFFSGSQQSQQDFPGDDSPTQEIPAVL